MSASLRAARAARTIEKPCRRQPLAALWGRIETFVLAGAKPYSLGFFRIAVSLLAIIQVFVIWPYLRQLYGNFGFIQWAVIETEPDTWLPSIGKLAVVLHAYGVSSSNCVYGVFVVYLLSLLGLLVGWKTRFFAICAWLLHTLTVNSGFISLYGVDTMIHVCLFYFVWMPVGCCFSIDRALKRAARTSRFCIGLSMRTLQLHLCIIYLNTGLAKAIGPQWWTGEAIWRAVMQPQFSILDHSWLASFPWLAQLAGWVVMVVEVGYAVFIWPAWTRRIWLVATIGLHIGIILNMGLLMFSILMIAMNLSAFGSGLESWRKCLKVLGAEKAESRVN